MTLIMQIYLTIGLALLVNLALSITANKLFEDSWDSDVAYYAGSIWIISSIILFNLYAVYFLLALIWHWY